MNQMNGGTLMDVLSTKRIILRDESGVNVFPIDGDGNWFSENGREFRAIGTTESVFGWKNMGAGYGQWMGRASADSLVTGVFTGNGVLTSFTGGSLGAGVRKTPLSLFAVTSAGIKAWSAVEDDRQQILGRICGYGDASEVSFSFYVGTVSVRPSTFLLVHTQGGNQYTATDNGSGVLSGTNVASGTVNYETGEVSVTFTTAPDLASAIAVSYDVDSWLKIEEEDVVGEGDGNQTNFTLLEVGNPNVRQRSVRVKATISSAEYYFVDDGSGNLAEVGGGTMLVSGSITYSSGAMAMEFATAPDDGTDIIATYQIDGLIAFDVNYSNGTTVSAKFNVAPVNGSRVIVVAQTAVSTGKGSGLLMLATSGNGVGIRTLQEFVGSASEAYEVPERVMKVVAGTDYVTSFSAKVNAGTGYCYIRAFDGNGTQVSIPEGKYSYESLTGDVVRLDDPSNSGTFLLRCTIGTSLTRFGARIKAPVGATCLSMSFQIGSGATYFGESWMWLGEVFFSAGSALTEYSPSVLSGVLVRPSGGEEGQYLRLGADGLFEFAEIEAAEGGGGGGISSLNGLTAPTQVFAVGSTGTAPAYSSVGGTHTLNIPMANAALVTAGLLSKVEYDDLNSRVQSAIDMVVASGKTVTAGNIVELISGGVSDIEVLGGEESTIIESTHVDKVHSVAVSATVAVVSYILNDKTLKAVAVDIASGEAVFGTPITFGDADELQTAALTTGKVIVSYKDSSDTFGKAVILSVSGSTLTAGSATTYQSSSVADISVARIDDDNAITTYRDNVDTFGKAVVLSVSGTTITAGSVVAFTTTSCFYTTVSMNTTSKGIVCYQDAGNSNYGTAVVLNVSAGVITLGASTTFASSGTAYTKSQALGVLRSFVAFRDLGGSDHGKSCVLNIVAGSSGDEPNSYPLIGTEAVFESASSPWISVTMLTDTKAIVCYQDFGNSMYGTACILSISGTTITAGTPVVFVSASSDSFSVTMLTDTKAIVCYADGGNSYYGTACVLSISGTTITAGTPVVFESAASPYISVAMLTNSKAIVCYRDDGNSMYGTACVLSISGTTITAGTPVVFESANSPYISVTMLTDTKAIVCYRDDGNSYYGTACVLSISGTTITAGTPVVFESAQSDYISVAMLTDTKAIVCYQDNGNSGYGTACVLSISGTTITAGTPVVFESAASYYFSVAMLTDTKAIVCYRDAGNSGYGTYRVLGISGTSIGVGEKRVYNAGTSSYNSAIFLNPSKFIVAYEDGGNSSYGTACVVQVSDETIIPATETVFESASSPYISVAMLTDTKAIVCYMDQGNSNYGTACVLSISGTTITAGTPVVFESAASFYISVAMLTDTKAIVCYTDNGNSGYGTACVLSISGTTITAGTPVVFESANSTWISVTMLTDTKAVVCYRDDGNSFYGTACVLSISGTTITAGTPVVFESANSFYFSVTMLTDMKAIVCYRDAGNSAYGTACILSISGTTITAGTPVVFESTGSYWISVTMLTDTKAVVCYRDQGNFDYGTSRILYISGTTLTFSAPYVYNIGQSHYNSVALLSGTQAIVCYQDVGNLNYGAAKVLEIPPEPIDVGAPAVFESATSSWISVTMLTDTKAIVCYRDDGNSSYGTACVLSISGTTITAGTPVVFESANSSYISVTMLTDTKAIVCYTDSGNSNYGTACVLSISGTTITAGTPAVFESAQSFYFSVTMLTDTKAIVCYQDAGNSNYGTACVLSISGTTITAGTPVVFESASSSYISVTMLTDTKAIVCYTDSGNSNYGTACVLSISGTTITAGTPAVFESAQSFYFSVTMLTDTKAIVCYRDDGNSNYGTACVLSISGTTVTAGTPVVFESAQSDYISVTMLTDTKAIVCYRDNGNSLYGTACVLSISGTTITAGTPVVFESAQSNYISVTMLTDTKAIVCYTDSGNSNYGTATILEPVQGGTTESLVAGTIYAFNTAATTVYDCQLVTTDTVIVTFSDTATTAKAVNISASGDVVTSGTPTAFSLDAATSASTAPLSTTKLIGAYEEDDTAIKSVIVNRSGATLTRYVTQQELNVVGQLIGYAKTSASSGNPAKIDVGPFIHSLTGLTTGAKQYASYSGGLTETVTEVEAGYAVSATIMKMKTFI